ncbi:MAG: glycoside hydrolase family 16 protein [Treponemataceae bacterium]|nr:glycoside hydrolase family 16 protein [Treponemataceae bacterium]
MKTVTRVAAKASTIIALCLILAAVTLVSGCASKGPELEGWHLVWNDEFNGKTIDRTKWGFQYGTGSQYGLSGWGNEEEQYYTEDNAYIEKGNLVIEARREDKEGMKYTSARLRTMADDTTPLFTTTFGKVEARIKMPVGNGIWPAFWMLPATDDYTVWAASGEIDIMEARGRLPNRTYGTLHFGSSWPSNKYAGSMYKFPAGETMADYHVYAVEWLPGLIRWSVDGTVFYETSDWWSMAEGAESPYPYPAPYDKPFYILLNLALGGTFDTGYAPDESKLPAKMYVDYVRVWQRDEPYNMDVKRPKPKRDSEKFASFTAADAETGNFIADPTLSQADTVAMIENEMDIRNRSWYFLALSEFGGKASSREVTGVDGNSWRKVDIQAVGEQNYSVQLLQHLPLAQGYSYRIEFDAYADGPRQIAMKVSGDADNAWAVYSLEYHPQLTTEPQHFSYFFTMESATDATARLEFELGLDNTSVYLSNVRVTVAEL